MIINIEADTVESAIYTGLKKINKNRNDVKITVLEKGNKDFLGLTGDVKAKVRIEYEDYPCTQPNQMSETTTPSNSDFFSNEAVNEEDIKFIMETLKELLVSSGFEDVQLSQRFENEKCFIEIQSEDSSLIIGKHGKTLNAYQLLINTIAHRHLNKKANIILDSEDYRNKRMSLLEKMVNNYISKLRKIKKDVYLPPMNSTERKIIHNFLSNAKNVFSESVGTEPMRRIKLSLNK